MTASTAFPPQVQRVLADIARDVLIISPLLFRIADETPEMAQSEMTLYPNEPLDDPLISSLTTRLYHRFYCQRTAPTDRAKADTDMLASLQEANTTMEGWDIGWEIVTRDQAGTLVVRNGARNRLVDAESYRLASTRRGGTEQADLWRRREDITLQQDYYYAYGKTLGDRYEDHVNARLYMNVASDAAPNWTRLVTGRLNEYGIPFTFKILRHSAAYERIDTCILYVPRRHANFAASIMVDLSCTADALLRRPTPLFARRISRGVAIADNPPAGTSFGVTRMRLVAEGIVAAWRQGESGIEARLRAISTKFRTAELDIRRPWLNPGNVEFVVAPRGRSKASRTDGPAQWIDVAERLGSRLVRDAIWHRQQCTWLGWSVIPGSESGKSAVCTAGGDLYAGTAGIAMFLAHLARVTQDERHRSTAMGAFRQAIARSERGYWPIGAYSGVAGLLHGAIALADALQSDEAAASIPILVERLATARPLDPEVDVIEGRAGAIRTLLEATRRDEIASDLAVSVATRLGHEIISLANRNSDQLSWRTTLSGTSRHLLGYSHGASGISCALYALFQKTGDPEFLQGANGALNYEWSGFDPEKNNWPDLRRLGAVAHSGEPQGQHFLTAWCSGAPGTALALARRLEAGHDPVVERRLEAAVKTTLESLAPLEEDAANRSFCLCHGVAGNAEILLQIDELTDRPELRKVAIAAAEEGMRNHHGSGTWPCGIKEGGESPSLLLGLAGIGYFYLRLHDPSIASPLLL